jgi:hypothetical protein
MAAEFIPLYATLVLGALAAGALAVWWAWRLREELDTPADDLILVSKEPPPDPDTGPASPLLP